MWQAKLLLLVLAKERYKPFSPQIRASQKEFRVKKPVGKFHDFHLFCNHLIMWFDSLKVRVKARHPCLMLVQHFLDSDVKSLFFRYRNEIFNLVVWQLEHFDSAV